MNSFACDIELVISRPGNSEDVSVEKIIMSSLFPGNVGGVQPQKTQKNQNPKWDFKLFLGFLGFLEFFLEKGVESTYLNIPDHFRPTCFLHFFREISPGSDT